MVLEALHGLNPGVGWPFAAGHAASATVIILRLATAQSLVSADHLRAKGFAGVSASLD